MTYFLNNKKHRFVRSKFLFIYPYLYIISLLIIPILLISSCTCPYAYAIPYSGIKKANAMNTGVMLTNDKGKILYEKNIEKEFIPASTLKMLTALETIHFLGQNFHFHTDFFIDKNYNLKIKGYGDPLFTSEAIRSLCLQLSTILKQHKIITLKSIIIDDSFFSNDIDIPGAGNSYNPYDASVGALCANFNTVFFKYDKLKNKFISAEPQTPLLNFTKKRIKASMLKKGRIVLTRQESRIYPGLLIEYFLKLHGINIGTRKQANIKRKQSNGKINNINNHTSGNKIIKLGHINDHDKKILTWESPYTTKEIIKRLLMYSNNFIANQLFLYIGAKESSPPATISKGILVLKKYAKNTLGIRNIKIYEGSGLSRSNRISPKKMMKLLFAFMPYHNLMRHNIALTKCSKIRKILIKSEEFYKTGTLEDVRTRVGYFKTRGRLYPYVIMINQKNCGYQSIKKKLKTIVINYAYAHFCE